MFSKIIFILATVCIVNASVLTVNVFDDDPETEVASNPKDCNVQACDQLCRRLRFRGGVCVNGRCKCDNFLNAEVEVSEKTLSDLEDSVLQTDDPESEIPAKSSKCNLPACDLVCRWLTKTSGSCVNDRCKCAKSLVAKDEAEVASSPKKCTYKACYSQCRSGNYISGTCVKDHCKCYNSTNKKDEVPEKSLSNLEDSVLQQDDPETEIENKTSACNNQACDQLCRRLRFRGGVCVNGRCKCDNFLNAEVFVESLSNPEDSISPRACINQKCDDLCRKIKLRGGACIDGKCICNKYHSEQEDAVDEYSEFAPRRSCRLPKCNRKCTRRGNEGATCVDGRCKCYNNLQEKDSSPLNDVISNENEESNVILRIIEEELIVPPLSACNTVTCNQMCHRLNYAGGWCRFGQCQCY